MSPSITSVVSPSPNLSAAFTTSLDGLTESESNVASLASVPCSVAYAAKSSAVFAPLANASAVFLVFFFSASDTVVSDELEESDVVL